jgi:transcriptional regulator with XRE-family HTH domain
MSKKLGELIRTIRQEKGISLRKLAEKVNVSFVNISYIENGRIETSKSVIRSISKALDFDLDKLLSLANTVDDDIQNIINKRPASVPDFLRTAKNLTNEDWIELTKHVEKMKKKRK